ncbi:hypothetical protein AC792_14330 [Arthrobacter sp. RIT-PI-e]|uniref:hypothetical protein n=1 Tax=Arthrobacter sp. RIT-PI-e TaxID=1681197 RepID=UPI000675DB14|nr:hypothetical protein [Arthrobacter sp. RIT-PI-e]KNC17343.1 hypothetical protein AC792_14330 [Arthrobacter sp. RIT-PI-e]
MAAQLFHLEGPSLEQLKAQASTLYGPRALIVSAELVTVGGIRGMFARQHYEIVVEVPEETVVPPRPRGRRSTGTEPTGIKALLEQAELDEVRFSGASAPARGTSRSGAQARDDGAAVSTTSGLFEAPMDNLASATDADAAPPEAPAPPRRPRRSTPEAFDAVPLRPDQGARAGDADAGSDSLPHLPRRVADPAGLPPVTGRVMGVPPRLPEVLSAPGDLVVVVGLPAAAWEVTTSMAAALGAGAPSAAVLAGAPAWGAPGAHRGRDRREANAVRAAGVDTGHPVFVSLGSVDPSADTRELLALRPDQVWLAVDAGRKEADTMAWVGALRRSMERADLVPAGLAVVGSAATATPGTVLALGLRIGWSDGRAAVAAGTRRHSAGGRRRAGSTGIE